ncbi:MAG: phosphoenolpyruvate--protein phosphotransferase [Spirochaetales bacterium]
MTNNNSPALPVELPAPSDTALSSPSALQEYLRQVASITLIATEAKYVGIYLVDRATARLSLHAWVASDPRVQGRQNPPGVLDERGINRSELSVETLRDFMHAAPQSNRIATPIHDESRWLGAVVGVVPAGFAEFAPAVFHDVAAQLAAVVEKSRLSFGASQVHEEEASLELPSDAIQGYGVGEGVAVGPALVIRPGSERTGSEGKVEEDREQAIARLDAAIVTTRAELKQLINDTSGELFDVASLIFSAHLMMLDDEAFSGAMSDLVRAGQTPEDAVQSVVASFVRTFRDLAEPRLAEKAHDVRDIGQRLLAALVPESEQHSDVAGHIAVIHEALPSDLVRLALGHAYGVVIYGATVTAHISILAQSLGLPTLITKDHRVMEIAPQTPLLLDATEQNLLISPTGPQLLDHGVGARSESAAARVFGESDTSATERLAVPGSGAVGETTPSTPTADALTLFVNVNLLNDARRGAKAGAAGIGLYRSEFPFIIRNDFIAEEEQYRIYRSIVKTMPGKPVTLRTADIGGDKLLAGRDAERNPFLGVRGIRFSLANRDLFRAQLRAMLRAGHDADLGIMFPMVSSTEEIEDAREELSACIEALEREGKPHNRAPRVGAMVELPSAVVTIEEFAEQTDFLSIGTNDLIMYLLAVDRTNERLSQLYRSHHPVVLRTIADIAKRVGPKISELSVCGESAADPVMVPFYLGIGIKKLSVGYRSLTAVARIARECERSHCKRFAEEILSVRTLREMDEFLRMRSPSGHPVGG